MLVPFVSLLVLLMTRTRFSKANGDEGLLIDLEALSETVFQKRVSLTFGAARLYKVKKKGMSVSLHCSRFSLQQNANV